MRISNLGAVLTPLILGVGCGAAPKNGTADLGPGAAHSGKTAPANGVANAAGTATAGDAAAAVDQDLSKLTVLGPNDLALKIRAAFGIGLTTYTPAGGKAPMDYIEVNADLFRGAIPDTPFGNIPDTLGIPYYMAVSALAQIVGTNYATALASGTAGVIVNDCRKLADAENIVRDAYPAVDGADLQTVAPLVVAACNTDGAAKAVQAIIQSYAFLDKGSI